MRRQAAGRGHDTVCGDFATLMAIASRRSLPVTSVLSLAQALADRSDETGLVSGRASVFGALRQPHESDTGGVVSLRSGASAKLNECGLLHVRHTLIATKPCVAAEFRDVPMGDIARLV